ncbi:hypothetical protein FRC01_010185 [Tulasnella sp. 417]|nr:hypothetical protein FRC01_010185 [Tulasnella sp. 417]
MPQVVFELNKTTLVFLPGNKTLQGHVSQVTLSYPKQVLLTQAAENTFNDKKARISVRIGPFIEHDPALKKHLKEQIEAILKLDHLNEFPTPSLVQADGYSLLVESKSWDYGRTLDFTWGDQRLPPANRKWTFTFVPKERDLAGENRIILAAPKSDRYAL